MIPSLSISGNKSASNPSSPAEHIMPSDFIPRNSPDSIIVSPRDKPPGAPASCLAGICAPGSATGTICPTCTLDAPVTTCIVFLLPTSSRQTKSFSASGCLLISNIFPVTTPLIPRPGYMTCSTGIPSTVSVSAISSTSIPFISTSVPNHFNDTFIIFPFLLKIVSKI